MANKARLPVRRLAMWGICVLWISPGILRAQAPSLSSPPPVELVPGERASTEPPPGAKLEEIQPPLYYLEDAHGELRPAFGFTLDDFRKVYDEMHGLETEAPSPSYVLKKIVIDGKAESHFARVTIVCDILCQRDGVIAVPLALGEAVIAGDPEYRGDDPPVVAFDEKRGGYVAWIKGKPGREYRLTLKTLFPLAVVGDKTTLRLRVPSGTESELSVTVPMARAVAEVSEGVVLETAPTDDKTATRLTVGGLRGDFELAWHRPDVRAATAPTVLEAAGEILARVDNQDIEFRASLDVRGYGRPFDRFRIRLPIGAKLVPSSGSAYTLAEISTTAPTAQASRLVEVHLAERTLGPVNVRLAARRTLDASMFGQWIELTGFGVLGAVRQSGHLAVEVADELDLLWNPQLSVEQTEDLPDSLAGEDLAAGFKYFSQPCSLLARIAPRQTRVNVEPQYLAVVDADQIQLEATLKYTVRGKKARVLDIELGDWEYDEIGPEDIVAVDRVIESDSGRLSVPLRQPSSGKIEVTIKAHRPVATGAETLRLTFPRPVATTVSPATVVIVPEDRVQLTVDATATRGLSRQPSAPPMVVAEYQQPPLFYRGDPAKAVFVAAHRVHSQQIVVSSTTTISLGQAATEVKQKFSYKIDYEPLDSMAFDIPRSLGDPALVEFRLAGERVVPTVVSGNLSGEALEQEGPLRARLTLREPQIGLCDLEVRYSLAPHRLVPRSCVESAVGLVVPLDGELGGNRLVVAASPELQVSMTDSAWTRQFEAAGPKSSSAGSSLVEFAAEGRVGEADLRVSLEAREIAHPTVVQRALVQTWLGQRARQDRALFRFTTHERSLDVVLPRGTAAAQAEVLLNGQTVETHPVGEAVLRVDLPEAGSSAQWLMEVRSHGAGAPALRGRCALEVPRLANDPWVRRVYWQLTLPRNEHLVYGPSGLVREYRWGWNGVFWGRRPLLATADLEEWVGASETPKLPAGDDAYLFSAFGDPKSFDLVVLSRSWIVLAASGAALVLGLLLIYVPASRHPAGLFVLAIVLGSAALWRPEPTVLVLQAASLGLVLVLLAGYLERSVARRRHGLVTLETAGSGMEKDSTQTQVSAVIATPSATETLPPSPPDSSKTSSVSGSSQVPPG